MLLFTLFSPITTIVITFHSSLHGKRKGARLAGNKQENAPAKPSGAFSRYHIPHMSVRVVVM